MIIQSIELKNFMKYESAVLSLLPNPGLIAITGANESGKSSIGDALCFALFGRTSTLDESKVHRCVRWGAYQALVTLQIQDGNGETWRLLRTITDDGETSVELTQEASDSPSLTESHAEDRLRALLGVGFDEFEQTFHFTQHTSELINSAYITQMCGMEAVQAVADDLLNERDSDADELQSCSDHRRALEAERDSLESKLQELDTLRQELKNLTVKHDQNLEAGAILKSTLADFKQKQAALILDADSLKTLTAEVSWATWDDGLARLEDDLTQIAPLIAAQPGDVTSQSITGPLHSCLKDTRMLLDGFSAILELLAPRRIEIDALLTDNATEAQLKHQIEQSHYTQTAAWLGVGVTALVYLGLALFANLFVNLLTGSGATLLAVLIAASLVLLARTQKRSALTRRHDLEQHLTRLDQARVELQSIENLSTLPLHNAFDALQDHPDQTIRDISIRFADGPGSDLIDTRRIHALTHEIAAQAQGMIDRLQPILVTLTTKIEQAAQEKLQIVEEKVHISLSQHNLEQKIRPLHEIESELGFSLDETQSMQRRVEVLDTALELLQESSEQMNRRFNQDIRKIVSTVLPNLSDGHYEAARIVPPFELEVFSREKQDFVGLDYLSNGTRRQILFAFRLALAEHLVRTRSLGAQFLFLDEPFAFFDEARTRNTMALFPSLSTGLTQFFITGQKFDDTSLFDLVITCNHATPQLEAGLVAD